MGVDRSFANYQGTFISNLVMSSKACASALTSSEPTSSSFCPNKSLIASDELLRP